MVPSSLSSAVRTGALGLALTLSGVGLAGPVAAAPKAPQGVRLPVQRADVSCVGPSSALEFGGATASLTFSSGWLRRDDVFVVVPLVDATGFEAGDRITVDRRQRSTTVVLPADGTALTPASTLEVRRGGDVLQRIPVRPGCGVLDPTPERGPVLGPTLTSSGAVTVDVTNGSSGTDQIGVTLMPVGGNAGETRWLLLEPGESGVVTWSGVAAGSYILEAFGYTSFLGTDSEPFTIPG